jgi:hypothetical protein
MMRKGAKLAKSLLCLMSNGDVPVWSSQSLYEMAWDEGIRPLNEDALKPYPWTRRKRRRTPGDDTSTTRASGGSTDRYSMSRKGAAR